MNKLFTKLYTKTRHEYYIQLSKYLDNETCKFIVTANPETFTLAQRDFEISDIITNENNDIIPDGIAVVKAARFYGIEVAERITGIDTAVQILELLNNKKKTLYLFGAQREVLARLEEKIKKEYPRIKILGTSDGYIEDKDSVMEHIISLKPDTCLVALGIPEQEKLIARHISKATKGIYMGVGGTFDVLSGTKKRAPKIFIKLNLEWLYRIIKEPSRIKRFWNNNVAFVIKSFFEKKNKNEIPK